MKLKGDLDSIGLGELFQTLASQRATGILTVTGSLGQKIIAIASGEIAVLSDRTSERSHIGDLLIARGRLTEAQLADALKAQRESDQRSPLGEVLVKNGFVKEDDIFGSLKFQLEEEICDLFTWKGANFEFDSERTIDEAVADDGSDGRMHRMSIEPQAVIAEASRRMAEWSAIESRLPSPYLCFKLTEKGDEGLEKANKATQQVLKLLREGRTIETTVKRSCLGRFNVCKLIVKLLDDGWLFPYPATDLRTLASEHRAHKRFSDALYIYRRLLEATELESDRNELQALIDETLDDIRKAQEAGEEAEGSETISYKEAAERFRRRQGYKRIASLVFCGAALVVLTVRLTQLYSPPAYLHEDYKKAIEAAEEAVKKKKFEEAAKVWLEFYEKIPNKDGVTARLVQEHIQNLPIQSNKHIENQLKPAEAMEEAGQLDKAEQEYVRLLREFPNNPFEARIKDGLVRVDRKRRERKTALELSDLRARLEQAREFLSQKTYTLARSHFQQVLDAAGPHGEQRAGAEEGLRELKAIEDKIREKTQAAEAQLKGLKGEAAIEAFEQAAAEWRDLPQAEAAMRQAQRLKAKLSQARQDLADAEELAKRALLDGVERMQQIMRESPEFEEIQKAGERLAELNKKAAAIDARINAARDALKRDKAEGRRLFAKLARDEPTFLLGRKVDVPILVNSNPTGAAVFLNGARAGITPADLVAPAGRPVSLRLERAGYETVERANARLAPEDNLEILIALKRQAAQLELKSAILAPPTVIDNKLYVLHGNSFSALDPATLKIVWTATSLFDDNAQTRPSSTGAGLPVFVGDKSWWYPRWAPEPSGSGKLLLPLRTRDVIEIDLANQGNKRTLFSLPVEPAGRAHLESNSLLVGKSLIAVGTADGMVHCFDALNPAEPLWKKQADPASPAPKGGLLGGLISGERGFIAVTVNGHFTRYNAVKLEETGKLDLNAALSEATVLPPTTAEPLAALIHTNGVVTVVDVNRLEKVWELVPTQAMEEVSRAAVGKDGIYVMMRNGVCRKFPRDRHPGRPAAVWSKDLDGGTETPVMAANSIYMVTTFGTLYALSPKDGSERWTHKIQGAVAHIVEHGGRVYVATKDGRLLMLSAE